MKRHLVYLLLIIGGIVAVWPPQGFSQDILRKSQILRLQEAKYVVVGKIESFGPLPLADTSISGSTCQTLIVRIGQVIKGRVTSRKIKVNVEFFFDKGTGLAGPLSKDEDYVFLLTKRNSTDECHYDRGETDKTFVRDLKLPAYEIELEGIIEGNEKEIRAVRRSLYR